MVSSRNLLDCNVVIKEPLWLYIILKNVSEYLEVSLIFLGARKLKTPKEWFISITVFFSGSTMMEVFWKYQIKRTFRMKHSMEMDWCPVFGMICKYTRTVMRTQIIHQILGVAMKLHQGSCIDLMSLLSFWRGNRTSVYKKSKFLKLSIEIRQL